VTGSKTKRVTATEARDNLSDLLKEVSEGGRVAIERYGSPVAVLVGPHELRELDLALLKADHLDPTSDYDITKSKNASLQVNTENDLVQIHLLHWVNSQGEDCGLSFHMSEKKAQDFLNDYHSVWENVEQIAQPVAEIFVIKAPSTIKSLAARNGGFLRVEEKDLTRFGLSRVFY